ncbi:MAG TPA: AraC family transcriptional regulator [Chitinophagaceae bacterium]|nr:AraC family transcriptional regulator [Chitinophagaceae bacterium]
MRVIPFKISKNTAETFRIQVDDAPYLYNHLHQHPEIQLTIIKQSHGTLVAGDYVGHFAVGDVFVIGANQPHVFRNDEVFFKKKLKAVAISVFFDETTIHPTFWQLPELKSLQFFLRNSANSYRIHGEKKTQIGDLLNKLVTAEGIDKLILFLEILKLLSTKKNLELLASQTIQHTIKAYDGKRLNNVLEFTFREYYRPVRLEEVASIANLSIEAFCKYFKARTRKTYINFLNEIRVNNACKLLEEDDRLIADICYETGFSNLSNFNRVFKKIKKCRPQNIERTNSFLFNFK